MRGTAFLLAAAMVCLMGCDGDEPTAPALPSFVGSYTLLTANGNNLPCVFFENSQTGYTHEVIGGSCELRADGTCTFSTEFRKTEGGESWTYPDTDTGTGTYAVDGQNITFELGTHQYVGTIFGDTFTFQAYAVLVYRKT